jgi:hypothetical protein
MHESDLLPDVITYNAAISACENGVRWQMALITLGAMPEARAAANEISYNAGRLPAAVPPPTILPSVPVRSVSNGSRHLGFSRR